MKNKEIKQGEDDIHKMFSDFLKFVKTDDLQGSFTRTMIKCSSTLFYDIQGVMERYRKILGDIKGSTKKHGKIVKRISTIF